MTIKMCDCKSRNIAAYGYDEASKTLAVKFKSSGKTYHYADVPKSVFEQLGGADSVGKFFAAHIRLKYKASPQ